MSIQIEQEVRNLKAELDVVRKKLQAALDRIAQLEAPAFVPPSPADTASRPRLSLKR